ncbi:MAG: serine/threonine protein kinase [Candidatus Obscuribacterales bacterium]|nr:serine/threonine protein kinase [Candidatus Obscuribacterales bacterium]
MSIPEVGKIYQERYLIIKEIGVGGMGVVYHAKQLDANRDVALKLLRIEKGTNAESVTRFYREFKTLAKLSHPNIMVVYGLVLDEQELPFAVCEFLEGRTLSAELAYGEALEWRRALRVGIQICEAMQYAHLHGVIHRDLKPGNIILQDFPEPDSVKVVDFGLSKALDSDDESQKLTLTGQLVGSVQYMAPELAEIKANERTDIYSFGCILFEMLTGELLFPVDNAVAGLYRHKNEDPRQRLNILPPNVPDGLSQLLENLLAKEPAKRIGSMGEIADLLKQILLEPSKAIQIRSGYSSDPKPVSRAKVVLFAAALVSVLGISVLAYTQSFRQTKNEGQQSRDPSTQLQEAQSYFQKDDWKKCFSSLSKFAIATKEEKDGRQRTKQLNEAWNMLKNLNTIKLGDPSNGRSLYDTDNIVVRQLVESKYRTRKTYDYFIDVRSRMKFAELDQLNKESLLSLMSLLQFFIEKIEYGPNTLDEVQIDEFCDICESRGLDKELEAFLRTRPGFSNEPQYKLACFLQKSRPVEALAIMHELSLDRPGNTKLKSIYCVEASLLLRLKKYDEALQITEKALELSDDKGYWITMFCLKIEALKALNKSVELQAASNALLSELSTLLSASANTDDPTKNPNEMIGKLIVMGTEDTLKHSLTSIDFGIGEDLPRTRLVGQQMLYGRFEGPFSTQAYFVECLATLLNTKQDKLANRALLEFRVQMQKQNLILHPLLLNKCKAYMSDSTTSAEVAKSIGEIVTLSATNLAKRKTAN